MSSIKCNGKWNRKFQNSPWHKYSSLFPENIFLFLLFLAFMYHVRWFRYLSGDAYSCWLNLIFYLWCFVRFGTICTITHMRWFSLLKWWCMQLLVKSHFLFVMSCAIWYHLYNYKNVKNTHGGMLILVKLQVAASNFT